MDARQIRANTRYHHGDLRNALIVSAAQLIEQEGLMAFSMVSAARRLGVSSAAPYRHFRDRNDLLNAVNDLAFYALSLEVEAMASDHTPGSEDFIVALGVTYVGFQARHQPFYELMWGRLGAEVSGELQLENRASGFRALIQAIALWCERQGIHHRRPEDIALAFWSMAHGLCVLRTHSAFTYYSDDTPVESMLRANAHTFLRGLEREAGRHGETP